MTDPATHSDTGRPQAREAATPQTADLNVLDVLPLTSPAEVLDADPITPGAARCVLEGRDTICQILAGLDRRLLVVLGPCSIHDEEAALEYARKLKAVSQDIHDRIFPVMRVYFEKPRTTTGWKGLINDPYLDGSFAIDVGLHKARKLLLAINELGVPAGTEILEPITPQYLADLIAWGTIGARTSESQTHREMASGLSMPIGYKNSTEGNVQVATDAMKASCQRHSFLGIDRQGRTAIIRTRGNRWGHLILRGGRTGPNYEAESVAQAAATMDRAGLPPLIMVDCSHANSAKKAQNQPIVWENALHQRIEGNRSLIGMMIESNLVAGRQPFTSRYDDLVHGQSITDECIGWEATERLLREAYNLLG
jgi:3-deoxy-7-phosphoheptulonate synthase